MPHLQRGLRGGRRAIDIPAWAISDIQLEAWAKWPEETGGILLGRSSSTGATVHHDVGPGPEAVHARHGFTPDADWQAERVAEAWTQDNSIEYLGVAANPSPPSAAKASWPRSVNDETDQAALAHW